MAKRTCSIDGCEKQHFARGWCQMHYRRWQIGGDPGPAGRLNSPVCVVRKSARSCEVDGCDRPVDSFDMCAMHYTRWKRHGDVHREAPVGRSQVDGFVSYGSAHRRVVTERGRADGHPCVECGSRASDWAYTHDDPNEMSSLRTIQGRIAYMAVWSADPKHYQPMCHPCHTKYDRTHRQAS